MARVIKKGGTKIADGLSPPSKKRILHHAGRRVIEKEVFAAQQEAAKILMDAEVRRTQVLEVAQKKVATLKAEQTRQQDRHHQVQDAKALIELIMRAREKVNVAQTEMASLTWTIFEKIAGGRSECVHHAMTEAKHELQDEMRSRLRWTLKVHPEDWFKLNVLGEQWEAVAEVIIPEMKFVQDPSMPHDQVMVSVLSCSSQAPLQPIVQYLRTWFQNGDDEFVASTLPTLEGDILEDVSELSELKEAQGLQKNLNENMYNDTPEYAIETE